MTRWDDPQPPFDWEAVKQAMFAQLRRPVRLPEGIPMRASLYRALRRRQVARAFYRALGLR